VLALAAACIASTSTSAHRLDEYLQAARIALELDGVTIDADLTPGVAVATSIISLIDANDDGSLSPDEQRAYARQVMDDLDVRLDGKPLSLRLSSLEFPDTSAFRRGEGTIRLQARAAHHTLSAGAHQLSLGNTHQSTYGAYLANALIPENRRISVTGQDRDGGQRELTIRYAVGESSATLPLTLIVVGVAAFAALVKSVHS
jgi:hypothetical protein